MANAGRVAEVEVQIVDDDQEDTAGSIVARPRRWQDDTFPRRRARGCEQVVHAAAVHERERRHLLLHTVFEDGEILPLQIGDELVGVVPDDDVHVDQIDGHPEMGPGRLRCRTLSRLAGRRLGGQDRGQSQDQGEARTTSNSPEWHDVE